MSQQYSANIDQYPDQHPDQHPEQYSNQRTYQKINRCTCGPHPHIQVNLSQILSFQNDSSNTHNPLTTLKPPRSQTQGSETTEPEALNSEASEASEASEPKAQNSEAAELEAQVLSACASHGCFHLTIHLHDLIGGEENPNYPHVLSCLAKSRQDVELDIESLFTPSFLCNIRGKNANNDCSSSTIGVHCSSKCDRNNLNSNTNSNPDSNPNNNPNNNLNNKSECNLSGQAHYGKLCNGGMLEVPFYNHKSNHLNDATSTASNNPAYMEGTFRGRSAESGGQADPEPKLSWEFRRCLRPHLDSNSSKHSNKHSNKHSSKHSSEKKNANNDSSKGEDTSNKSNKINNNNSKFNTNHHHLWKWTQAMHFIGCTLFKIIGIPSNIILQELSCIPPKDDNLECNECNTKCNIDLLRVFRYDAIAASSPPSTSAPPSPPPPPSPKVLGSSPHSDWGTLTIVWQDDKGGLETFCHACQTWSAVETSSPKSQSSRKDMSQDTLEKPCRQTSREKHTKPIQVFVHVGDFLSLTTMMKDNNDSNHNDNHNNPTPLWPSPRHRVKCPILQQRNDINKNDTIAHSNDASIIPQNNSYENCSMQCRRSLVYFAYPPPGISLQYAQRIIAPLVRGQCNRLNRSVHSRQSYQSSIENDDDNDYDNSNIEHSHNEFYSHYSLLHNQSTTDKNAAPTTVNDEYALQQSVYYESYRQIHQKPFDQVIQEKWGQVQRTS